MADRRFYEIGGGRGGTLTPGLVKLTGQVLLGASGAIATSAGAIDCEGFTIAKTGGETGRYTLTLEDKYAKFRGGSVSILGADDAAYSNTAGRDYFWRNDNVTAGGAAKTVDLQFVDGATSADAEVPNNLTLYIELTLVNSGLS